MAPGVCVVERVHIIHGAASVPGLSLCPAQLSKAHTVTPTLWLSYHQRGTACLLAVSLSQYYVDEKTEHGREEPELTALF